MTESPLLDKMIRRVLPEEVTSGQRPKWSENVIAVARRGVPLWPGNGKYKLEVGGGRLLGCFKNSTNEQRVAKEGWPGAGAHQEETWAVMVEQGRQKNIPGPETQS